MLIGLQSSTGARSGKDTVADIIQLHGEIGRYALASPIKESMNDLFGWGTEQGNGALKEVVIPTYLPNKWQVIEVLGKYKDLHEKLTTIQNIYDYGCNIYDAMLEWLYANGRVVRAVSSGGHSTGNRLIHVSPREMYQIFGTEMMRECISETFWLDIAPTENTIITDIRFPNEAEWLKVNGGILVDIVRPNKDTQVASHASESGTGAKPDYTLVNDGTIKELNVKVKSLLEGIYYE